MLEIPDFSTRCRTEMTRDVVFILQALMLQWLEVPDGYNGDAEDEMTYVIPYWLDARDPDDPEVLEHRLNIKDVYDRQMRFCTSLGDLPCVLAEWRVEGVWLSREEAEAYAQSRRYNYPHGYRVYGVCANGLLAELLKGT